MSTVQLANLRRGLQDHLYLTLARQAGLEPVVQETLQAVVPRVYSDAGETVGFAETGEAYEAARLKLGAGDRGAPREGEEVKPAACCWRSCSATGPCHPEGLRQDGSRGDRADERIPRRPTRTGSSG